MRSTLGGRTPALPVDASTKSSIASWRSIGLKRRSKPMVVEAFALMPAPQSEPATCPG